MKLSDLLGGSDIFRRNVKRVLAAGILSQIVGLIALPILSRLFPPESFGALTAFTLLQSILLAFVTARLEWLVPNARNEVSARRFLAAAFFALLISTLLLYVLLMATWFSGFSFGRFDSALEISEVVVVGAFLAGLFLILQACSVYANDLRAMSKAKVAQAVLTLCASLVLGYFAILDYGLIFAYVLGFFGAVALMKKEFLLLVDAVVKTPFRRALRVFSVYKRSIFASVSLSVVNVLFQSILAVLIIFFYGAVVAGWYGLVYRVATAPIGLITTSVSRSFWAEAAQLVKKDPRKLRVFYIQSVKRLAVVSLPFAVVFLLGPLYVPSLFGADQWGGAGEILAALTPFLVGMIVFSPTTHLIVYKKAHWQLWVDAGTCVLAVLVFSVAFRFGQSPAVSTFLASSVVLAGYILRFAVHLRANSQLLRKREFADL